MGFWGKLVKGLQVEATPNLPAVSASVVPAGAGPRFGVTLPDTVYPASATLDDWIFRRSPISRAEALQVPAVKRARDLIAGAIGQFPLIVKGPDGKLTTTFVPNLFAQPEPGTASSVTWTRVVEDLLFDERAWMRTLAVGWHGRVVEARRLDPATVTVQPDYVHYPEGSALVWPDVPGLIRIDSPNPGLLDNSPAIRACVVLQRAALINSDGTPPIELFRPTDPDVEPFEDDEDAADWLDDYTAKRRARAAAFIPGELTREEGGWDPEKLQLAQAREFAITEVARLTGIDAEDLSVAVTSRSYFNAQDRRRARIENVLGPYMTAIESRLSMDDVTPRGYTVAFDTSTYLRLDDLSSAQADAVLVGSKIVTRDEARAKRGLDPLGDVEPVDAAAVDAALSRAAALNPTRQEIQS